MTYLFATATMLTITPEHVLQESLCLLSLTGCQANWIMSQQTLSRSCSPSPPKEVCDYGSIWFGQLSPPRTRYPSIRHVSMIFMHFWLHALEAMPIISSLIPVFFNWVLGGPECTMSNPDICSLHKLIDSISSQRAVYYLISNRNIDNVIIKLSRPFLYWCNTSLKCFKLYL